MGFSGQICTWDNKKLGDKRIGERLDRALCSTHWRNMSHDIEIIHEPIIGSDHAPIRLTLHHFIHRNGALSVRPGMKVLHPLSKPAWRRVTIAVQDSTSLLRN
ncbi:hypothetical protein LINPERHAP2_LOCUS24274 [Linum perenne]